jgi:pimeloyl-ACP methyl ester carboxylesterase
MPGIIHAAARGDTKPMAPLIQEALDTYKSDDFSYGAFLSTECHDDWSYDSAAAIENAAASADVYGPFARANLPVIACPVWNVGGAPQAFHAPVRSDVPVLILTGNYDPITPPAWAEGAAVSLPKSTVIHFPGIGHGVIESHRCADQLALRYLDDPTKPLYHDCLLGVVAGPWSQTDDLSARLPAKHALGAK